MVLADNENLLGDEENEEYFTTTEEEQYVASKKYKLHYVAKVFIEREKEFT